MKLLLATTNPGKVAEIQAALRALPVDPVPLSTLGSWPEVSEDGETYEDNASKKARVLANFSGYTTLADDSGLEVEALVGAPGVHSARFSGPDANDARNNEKLLSVLRGLPPEKRGARFVCVLALCRAGQERLFRGECAGWIALEPRGSHGFGYDPLFFYPPLGKTFGEIDQATKSGISHRGRALRKLVRELSSLPVFS
jgi:XTP/dITP diphosphohydrolase